MQACADDRGRAMELIRFFFGFSGRVNRTKYWIGVGIVFAISLLALNFWSALPIWGASRLLSCGLSYAAWHSLQWQQRGCTTWKGPDGGYSDLRFCGCCFGEIHPSSRLLHWALELFGLVAHRALSSRTTSEQILGQV